MDALKDRVSRKWQSFSRAPDSSRREVYGDKSRASVVEEQIYYDRKGSKIERSPLWNDYSDLTISCKGMTWPAHKLVLCTQSDFFRNACKNNFREGRENIIYLEDDDQQVINAMLAFLYEKQYEAPADVNVWTFHAQVAAIADKYFILPLQQYAEHKFNAETEKAESLSGFSDAIVAAYDSGNQQMIRTVVEFTKTNHKRLFSKKNGPTGFREVLRDIPEYAATTAEVLAEQVTAKDKELNAGVRISKKTLKETTWYRCPDDYCEEEGVVFSVPTSLSRDQTFSCPFGCEEGHDRRSRWWAKHKIASPYSS